MSRKGRFSFSALSLFACLSLGLAARAARAEPALTFEQSKAWSSELAHSIPLFQAIWAADPSAELHGGTTFSYYLWFLSQFKNAATAEEASAIFQELKARGESDIRAFIWTDSDVDVLSHHETLSLSALDYGVKKIDVSPANRYNLEHEFGKSEFNQGFLPVEKMRLTKSGWNEDPTFGNGLREIFEGTPSLSFVSMDAFQSTHFAKRGINHPVLLVFRYLRRFSQVSTLFAATPSIPTKSRLVLQDLMTYSQKTTLAPLLKNDSFARWYKDGIWRGFRGHFVNPSLTYALYTELGLHELLTRYPESPPIHQIVREKTWNEALIQTKLAALGSSDVKFFQPFEQVNNERTLYHATKTDDGFENILQLGFFESTRANLNAGNGIYTTTWNNTPWVIANFGNHQKDRLISIVLAPSTRYTDITKGEGLRVYQEFAKANRNIPTEAMVDAFCENFGVDLLRYNYDIEAYVIKNTKVITQTRGVYRKASSLSTLEETALTIRDWNGLANFAPHLARNLPTTTQTNLLLSLIPRDSELGPLLSAISENTYTDRADHRASLFLFVTAQEYLFSIRNQKLNAKSPELAAYVTLIERADRLKPYTENLVEILSTHAMSRIGSRAELERWFNAQDLALKQLAKRRAAEGEIAVWRKSGADGVKTVWRNLIEPRQLLMMGAVALPCLAAWAIDASLEMNSNGAVASAIKITGMVALGIIGFQTFTNTLWNYLLQKREIAAKRHLSRQDDLTAHILDDTVFKELKKKCNSLLSQDLNPRKRAS